MELDKLEAEFKIAQTKEIGNTLSALSELAGKETATGKALGVASALVNTYVGVTEALRQKSTLPSPFDVAAKVVNVATILASGLKAVKAITSVQVPGGGGGGASVSAPSFSAGGGASTSAPQFNVVGNAGTNQLASSLGSAISQNPVQAYVVANDVTTAQSLNRNIVQNASLG
jgi:hypothetical protein